MVQLWKNNDVAFTPHHPQAGVTSQQSAVISSPIHPGASLLSTLDVYSLTVTLGHSEARRRRAILAARMISVGPSRYTGANLQAFFIFNQKGEVSGLKRSI